MTSALGHGRKAAQTLLTAFAGNQPPAVYDGLQGVTRQMYNFPALARFAIDRSTLPADAILLHRPQSYFEQHRSAILTGLGAVAILAVIIVLFVLNAVKQRRINTGNREILRLNREVIETQLELLSTLGEVIESRSQDTANHAPGGRLLRPARRNMACPRRISSCSRPPRPCTTWARSASPTPSRTSPAA